MKPLIWGCMQFKFYIICGILCWCVVRGIFAEVDIDVFNVVYSDVGGDVESGDGGKVEL